jgi:hypothetical protein
MLNFISNFLYTLTIDNGIQSRISTGSDNFLHYYVNIFALMLIVIHRSWLIHLTQAY